MGEKIVVGPINKGLRNDRTAFVIDNDSFPTLINAYQWRGRVKRKRGTSLLGRLQRFFNSASSSYGSISSFNLVAGAGNLLSSFALQADGNIVPGTVHLTVAGNVYTDNSLGVLTGVPAGSGTINYATGGIIISGGAGSAVTAVSFLYYPDLPVMGIEDLVLNATQFPGTLAFDTTYSYDISTSDPYPIHDVSFYKNLATATYTGYIQKTNWTPVTWNGEDYQQFWTVNYEGALWATNGINVPFNTTHIGMQFKPITGMNITSATAPNGPSIVTLTITGHGLVVGDFVFINEVIYTAPNTTNSINFQTGYVIAVLDANNVSVEFPNAYLTGTYSTGGIAQYLTNRSDTTIDCIRFYDGDPTNGSATAPAFATGHGWVNFMPPLSESNFSISQLPLAQYYLIGARMIVPFRDRLLFLGPVVQTSGGNKYYLQDTIVYSQNGTPYYTCSFTGDPVAADTIFHEILVPTGSTATAPAYFEDQTGFGGFTSPGLQQPMITSSFNGDVLLIGFDRAQTRLAYTGNELSPFAFYLTNTELGSSSTFSAINMDKGVITRGSRGFIITGQTEAQRIDLEIPDEVFSMDLTDNGTERVCAQRDFINEWIYFTYKVNDRTSEFPNQTLFYNYRDQSWAIFYECYTTYGYFQRQTGFTWQTVGNTYPTWASWNEPWNAGTSTLLQQEVLAGNQQGFIIFRDEGTNEANSLYIQSISGNTVTSPDHCLNDGDYIVISGALGTIGTLVNGLVFSIQNVKTDTFDLNPDLTASGTYLGGGLIKRLSQPFIQTKQFPSYWDNVRKTRLGPSHYLLSTTANSQITLLIYLSQDGSNPYNDGPIVPDVDSDNDSLIYSTVLFTCPESTNLGLTPANINLNMVTGKNQAQIWHRKNTSLIGDSIQIGFTLSDAQMRDPNIIYQTAEIELHGFTLDVSPSQLLA